MPYPVTIHHIYVSPGHNYFTHELDRPGHHPTYDVEQVQALASRGLVGDRFFDLRPDFDGQITFIAIEVVRLLWAQLRLSEPCPDRLRRNVVVEGIPLNQLIGQTFSIRYPHNGEVVTFAGRRHCHPCRWMDAGIGPGALRFLKGRGGLRCQILSDGLLSTGRAVLHTDVALDFESITEPLSKLPLP